MTFTFGCLGCNGTGRFPCRPVVLAPGHEPLYQVACPFCDGTGHTVPHPPLISPLKPYRHTRCRPRPPSLQPLWLEVLGLLGLSLLVWAVVWLLAGGWGR